MQHISLYPINIQNINHLWLYPRKVQWDQKYHIHTIIKHANSVSFYFEERRRDVGEEFEMQDEEK